ncbi:MAG: hydroxymethylglutaryl-CoA lyase [Proteobacteria bacterium]|nr:hydroxymethylglutaryl-CoA lyase [Pseudomonadota bacterium]
MNDLKIKIVEVGPRDGLQNEKKTVSTEIKLELINRLVACGLSNIETTSFVNPKWVPQMADALEVMAGLKKKEGLNYIALTPNLVGLERAIKAGCREVAIFGAASETFSQKNINCSVKDSLVRFGEVCKTALQRGIKVRGYVSCVMGCPYEGKVEVKAVLNMTRDLFEMGCVEVSLGDTIGIGTPWQARDLIKELSRENDINRLAIHFHDTRGQALANILACIELGVSTIDSSVAGLGGCPYAKGATGNVATEDLVYMLHGMGIDTGLNLDQLINTGQYISNYLGLPNNSKVGRIN